MDIEYLQLFAGLRLNDAQRRDLQRDLKRLQASIDRLQEVDVRDVQPSFEPLDITAPIGDAETTPPMERHRFLECVSQSMDGQVAVPQTVRGDGDGK